VDFCWQAAGPLVTRFLADLGAEVIKIESSVRVDRVREFMHPPENYSLNTGGFFADCNTNKQSVTIDLGTPGGIALVTEMIRTADVVTDNFTPGAMARWGLDYEELRRIRPDIIVARFPVMGTTGPKRDWRSIGNGVVALCGLAGHTGFPERPPIGLGTLHTDFTLAPLGATQVMAALLERERTGEGCALEIAQYEAATHLLDTGLLDYLVNGALPARSGNRSPEHAPHGVFPCRLHPSDSWVAIEARSTLEWQLLCEAMGRPDLAARPDLQDMAGRADAADEIEAAVAAWTATCTPWGVTEALQARGVPASPVEHVGDLLDDDPGMAGFYASYRHPEGHDFLVINQPWLWDGERQPLVRAPLLGEHNERVLRHLLGRDDDQVAELFVSGVMR
jgi:benzylsuccinate CoA-transferase BbsF subunit